MYVFSGFSYWYLNSRYLAGVFEKNYEIILVFIINESRFNYLYLIKKYVRLVRLSFCENLKIRL